MKTETKLIALAVVLIVVFAAFLPSVIKAEKKRNALAEEKRQVVLKVVQENPGLTAKEIHKLAELGKEYSVKRVDGMLSVLCSKGLVSIKTVCLDGSECKWYSHSWKYVYFAK